MRKNINVILIAILVIMQIAGVVIGKSNFTTVYSTDIKLDKITYMGKELLSEDTVKNTISFNEFNSSKITLPVVELSKPLDGGIAGFEEYKSLTKCNNVSYQGMLNLVFNLQFMGIPKCEKEFGVSFNEASVEEIVHAYLYNVGELHDAASAVATSLKCPGYQATLTSFDLDNPAYTVNDTNYYGPFTFSDNTMGFAEVVCDTGCGVYVQKDATDFENVKYVSNDSSTYYLGVPSGVDEVNLKFEGVSFTPDFRIFSEGVLLYGVLRNDMTAFTFEIKGLKESDENASVNNSETTAEVANDITLQVSKGDEKIPDTIIIYNEDNEVEDVILNNTSAEVNTSLDVGTYTMEKIYSDNTCINSGAEFVVTENAINEVASEVTYDFCVGLFDKELNAFIEGKGYIYDDEDNVVRAISFDSGSGCRLVMLPPGYYKIVVTDIADGYNKPSDYTFVVKETNPVAKIPVTKATGSSYIVIKDGSGTLLEGVQVSIDNQETMYTTDANGAIEVGSLTTGEHTCTIEQVPAGYVLPKNPITFSITEEITTVKQTIVLSKIKFNLRVTKTVDGSTVEVPDAVYSIKQTDAPYFAKVVSVSEFPLELEVGDYTITEIIAGEGYNFSDETTQTLTADSSENVTVSFKTAAQTGTLAIRNYSVKGYNDVLEGVSYKLFDLDNEVVAEGTSDATGKVLFEKLPLGTYTLQQEAVPTGYVPYKKLLSVKIQNAGEVISYDSISAINVGSITVYHETATAGIPYYLYSSSGSLQNIIYTDSDGKAVFKELLPGKYTVKNIEGSQVTTTPTKSAWNIFQPIIVQAYSGDVEITLENPNIAVGAGTHPATDSTAKGTSIIELSKNVEGYDSSVTGSKDLGALNVDNISTTISQTATTVDYSNDVTESAVDNVVETVSDEDGDVVSDVVGSTYVADTGVLSLSPDNNSLGDGDFSMNASDVAGLLDKNVKLPKTGVSYMETVLLYGTVLVLGVLLMNNLPKKKISMK